jgi:Transposase DDE domain
MTARIQADLQHAQLLPSQQFMDAGYVNAEVLAKSYERFGIDVVSPAHPDPKWQASTEGGIDATQFQIDWERQRALCPQGRTSVSWTLTVDNYQRQVIKIRFSTKDCRACPLVARCTFSRSHAPRRLLTIRPRDQYEALHAARRRQTTRGFAQPYALRSGIEATISEASSGLRVAPLALQRSGKNASTTYRHSHCHESDSCRCLVRRRRTRSHAGVCFPTALRCSVKGFPNSVKLRKSPRFASEPTPLQIGIEGASTAHSSLDSARMLKMLADREVGIERGSHLCACCSLSASQQAMEKDYALVWMVPTEGAGLYGSAWSHELRWLPHNDDRRPRAGAWCALRTAGRYGRD